jgi:hypothetical protein
LVFRGGGLNLLIPTFLASDATMVMLRRQFDTPHKKEPATARKPAATVPNHNIETFFTSVYGKLWLR